MGALLTGFGLYDRIAKFAGMGAALPITGFANAVVSPAIEFRSEGAVLGTGARIFQVAGPVIVYGLLAAFVVGLVHLVIPGLRP
ncbi:stage V sporulation protein AC [mine drainage metagenome]|uniref:Stage V sporulation protein AC n=1 Tax=mine drainage metagenome TaxID=410659 RepID=T1DBM8_9ZZZZ